MCDGYEDGIVSGLVIIEAGGNLGTTEPHWLSNVLNMSVKTSVCSPAQYVSTHKCTIFIIHFILSAGTAKQILHKL